MKENTLEVWGMHCPGYENLVGTELNPVPGFLDAETDSVHDESVIRARSATKDRVRQVIGELGYDPASRSELPRSFERNQ